MCSRRLTMSTSVLSSMPSAGNSIGTGSLVAGRLPAGRGWAGSGEGDRPSAASMAKARAGATWHAGMLSWVCSEWQEKFRFSLRRLPICDTNEPTVNIVPAPRRILVGFLVTESDQAGLPALNSGRRGGVLPSGLGAAGCSARMGRMALTVDLHLGVKFQVAGGGRRTDRTPASARRAGRPCPVRVPSGAGE